MGLAENLLLYCGAGVVGNAVRQESIIADNNVIYGESRKQVGENWRNAGLSRKREIRKVVCKRAKCMFE